MSEQGKGLAAWGGRTVEEMLVVWAAEEDARVANGECAQGCGRKLVEFATGCRERECYFCAEESRVLVAEYQAAAAEEV